MPQVVSGVDVTIAVEQATAPQGAFGRCLCLENVTAAQTAEADVALRRRARVYTNALAVQTAGEASAVQEAANVWFGGTREPKAFLVGTQFAVPQPIMIYGDSFTVAGAEALGDTFSITMGGRTIMADFDALTTFDAIATALETGLNAHGDITGAEVSVIGGDRLQIQLPGTLEGSVTFDATADDLGLGPADDVTYYTGIANAEEADDAITRIVGLDPDFTFIGLPDNAYNDVSSGESADDRIATISTWAQANDRIFDFADFGSGPLVTDETTSNLALQYALKRANVAGSYTGDSAGLLPFGNMRVLSAVDPTQVGTARNVANRVLPGLTPITLTDAQAAELDRKRVNYYRREGNFQHTRGGITFGEWYEAQYFLLWLKNAVAIAAYNYSLRLEAFTGSNADYAGLRAAIAVPLQQGVDSGFLLPGTVSDSVRNHIRRTTGDGGFDGNLREGYWVWNANAATATQAQLNARDSLTIYFWAKGAPFINSINISGNYGR